ncbi:tRNA (guanosine(46)-N7)-methyltransferase TrmB [Aeromicrobium panaciterrae]
MSFTRRGGRLTERQQNAWDRAADQYVIDVPRHGPSTSVDPSYVIDAPTLFSRTAPLIVEIGSGRGEALVHAAKEHPDHDFLGLEVYVPGVAQTLVTTLHERVTNIRLAVVNAPEALTTMLPDASVRELRIWFPDPWHKARHNKRRLITPGFTQLAVRVLEPGGVLRLATDWEDYAEQMRDVVTAAAGLDGGEWSPRFEGRPVTRFEQKGLDKGRTIRDISAVRTNP